MTSTVQTVEMQSKNRSSVEFNGMELIIPILLKCEDVNCYQDLTVKLNHMRENSNLYDSVIILNNPHDFDKYVEDIQKKEKIIVKSNYISNFKKNIINFNKFNPNNINCIYISGKINRHSKIEELNKNLKKIETKSDIYVEFVNGEICGISIKQSVDATKSNYSVHKILGPEYDSVLTNTKKQFLNQNGITCFNKSERDKVNRLFYSQNKNNLYWEQLREIFIYKNNEISKKLVELLYCSNINYDLYEYDGNAFEKINKNINEFNNVSFEEYKPYYLDKKGKERNAAKMFYRLIVGEKIYRVEIRWKGNIYNSAPQFQIHNE